MKNKKAVATKIVITLVSTLIIILILAVYFVFSFFLETSSGFKYGVETKELNIKYYFYTYDLGTGSVNKDSYQSLVLERYLEGYYDSKENEIQNCIENNICNQYSLDFTTIQNSRSPNNFPSFYPISGGEK